jgi:serine/threonine protein kinase
LIRNLVGIPNLYWYGNEHNYRVLVTDNLGPTLDQLLKYCEGKFSLKTVLMAVDQIIDRIQWVHDKKFIYNDIDPENLLIGLG